MGGGSGGGCEGEEVTVKYDWSGVVGVSKKSLQKQFKIVFG